MSSSMYGWRTYCASVEEQLRHMLSASALTSLGSGSTLGCIGQMISGLTTRVCDSAKRKKSPILHAKSCSFLTQDFSQPSVFASNRADSHSTQRFRKRKQTDRQNYRIQFQPHILSKDFSRDWCPSTDSVTKSVVKQAA